ncbi:MAG: hypothetical protein J6P19_08730, partial [Acetobacter sp.]|nr:hypothetical protein [Acetobacter sp.]
MNHALEENKDFLHVLIIGNGFDLAHELKTRYTDFLHSDTQTQDWVNKNILFISVKLLDSLKKIKEEPPHGLHPTNPINWSPSELEIRKILEAFPEKDTTNIDQLINDCIGFTKNRKQFFGFPSLPSGILYSKENWFNIERDIYEVICNLLYDVKTFQNLHNLYEIQEESRRIKDTIATQLRNILFYSDHVLSCLDELLELLKVDVKTCDLLSKDEFEQFSSVFNPYIRKNIKQLCNFRDIIYNDLRSFVDKFSDYLSQTVSKQIETLTQDPKFYFCLKELEEENTHSQKHTLWVLNFNYTPTFQKLYEQTLTKRGIKVHHCHIHGALGEGNLVLGCQSFDTTDKTVKIDPAWNVFTKHHQRHRYGTIDKYQELLKELSHFKGEVAFHILGHSLD